MSHVGGLNSNFVMGSISNINIQGAIRNNICDSMYNISETSSEISILNTRITGTIAGEFSESVVANVINILGT